MSLDYRKRLWAEYMQHGWLEAFNNIETLLDFFKFDPQNFSLPHECIYCTLFLKAITKLQIYIFTVNEIFSHPTASICISLINIMLAQNEITAIVHGIFKSPPGGNQDVKAHHLKVSTKYNSVLNRWLKQSKDHWHLVFSKENFKETINLISHLCEFYWFSS